MFNDITKPAPPLPIAQLHQVRPGVSLLPPLTRRGHGPGIIILVPDTNDQLMIADGVPSHLVKWAEEGYTAVAIQQKAIADGGRDALRSAVESLSKCDKCQPKDKMGLIGNCCSALEVLAALQITDNIQLMTLSFGTAWRRPQQLCPRSLPW